MSLGHQKIDPRLGHPSGVLGVAGDAQHFHSRGVRILHHEPGIAQPRAEEGHFFFDADLNRFLGPHGGGVHLDHDLHVRKLHFIFNFLHPVLV